jgi:uncharacterized protein (DUF885 family)
LSYVHKQLASVAWTGTQDDADLYLGLVAAYGRLIREFAGRTAGQAERGIRIPREQALQARSLLTSLKSGVRAQLAIAPQRESTWPSGFLERVEDCIASEVEPAFDHALAGISDEYLKRAPETVGIGQYPDGEALYEELVKQHTTLDLTPTDVQARGFERMASIEESISSIQSELGFKGNRAGFLAHLEHDPFWHANSAAEIEAVFKRYIDRLRPHIADLFPVVPKADYGVAPLPSPLQQSMTYGYYDPPNRVREKGLYLFNPAVLTKRPLFHLGALTYHELMPGHHLQLGLLNESRTLHPLRAFSSVTAYSEGWAEYAATLAGEIGLYETPEERYGRLTMDAFLTSRLVVDTGMNVLGWSLERARQWMNAHSRLTGPEIQSESVRYSCDIPAQALAYKLGDSQLITLRERMRKALGARFELRHFHQTVLETGALPLRDLEWHVERVMG